MQTRTLVIETESPSARALTEAAAILREGGLVAFPTETVYGLACDASSDAAVRRLLEVKQRPPNRPLPLLIPSENELSLAREVPDIARRLAEAFWPGPITLVCWKGERVLDVITAGTGKVGLRVPDHPVALALLRCANLVLATPSANTSGRPPARSAQDVLRDLKGQVELVLDGGPTSLGIPSSVVDVTVSPPALLREGALTREEIERVVGESLT